MHALHVLRSLNRSVDRNVLILWKTILPTYTSSSLVGANCWLSAFFDSIEQCSYRCSFIKRAHAIKQNGDDAGPRMAAMPINGEMLPSLPDRNAGLRGLASLTRRNVQTG